MSTIESNGMAQAPMLLAPGKSYSCTLPSQNLDFQARMFDLGVPRTPPGDSATPCVLVLTRSVDMEICDLSLTLAAASIRMVRIDADSAPEIGISPTASGSAIWHVADEQVEPRLAWLRHFDLGAMPTRGSELEGAYALDQWRAFIRWIPAAFKSKMINSYAHELDRLTQLSCARAAGLCIPETVLTSSPRYAVDRLASRSGWYVVKPLGCHWLELEPGHLTGTFPRMVAEIELRCAPNELAPFVVQEFVPSQHELRVYTIGDRSISFGVDKESAEQLWTEPDDVRVSPIRIPERLETALHALSDTWGLGVAAYDLLISGDDYVFLEVNTPGDWCYFERKAGCEDVSQAVHEYTVERFRRESNETKGF